MVQVSPVFPTSCVSSDLPRHLTALITEPIIFYYIWSFAMSLSLWEREGEERQLGEVDSTGTTGREGSETPSAQCPCVVSIMISSPGIQTHLSYRHCLQKTSWERRKNSIVILLDMIYKVWKNTKLIEPCLKFIDLKCLNMLWYMIQLGIFKLDSIDFKEFFSKFSK
jgi:hypothetical protein